MNTTGTIVLIFALFTIMLGMGLTLTRRDFGRIVSDPRAVLTGLVNQLILLPLIGFLLAIGFDLSPEVATGLMLVAACPGGATSNLIAHLSNGDTALSVSLTAISSLITIVSIPIIVNFSMNYFLGVDRTIELNVPQLIGQLLIIIVIPVSIGMWIRAKKPAFADRMERPVKVASALVLALVIAGIIASERDNFIPYFEKAGVPALLLNVITMIVGAVTAGVMRLQRKQLITVAIESGIQNGTLAIAIATITLQRTDLAIPGAIYSLIMFATGFAIILISTRSSTQAKA